MSGAEKEQNTTFYHESISISEDFELPGRKKTFSLYVVQDIVEILPYNSKLGKKVGS